MNKPLTQIELAVGALPGIIQMATVVGTVHCYRWLLAAWCSLRRLGITKEHPDTDVQKVFELMGDKGFVSKICDTMLAEPLFDFETWWSGFTETRLLHNDPTFTDEERLIEESFDLLEQLDNVQLALVAVQELVRGHGDWFSQAWADTLRAERILAKDVYMFVGSGSHAKSMVREATTTDAALQMTLNKYRIVGDAVHALESTPSKHELLALIPRKRK